MSRIKALRARLRSLLRGRAADRELEEEFRFHVEMQAEQYMREGYDAVEAKRRALLAFGGVERHREAMRDGRGGRWLGDAASDVRYAVRAFARSPGFTLVAAGTIALGVGATTAMVSVVNVALLRPLPVSDPEAVYTVYEDRYGGMISNTMGFRALPPERVAAYEEGARELITGLAAYRYGTFSLRAGEEAAAATGVRVTANYFDVLGVRPALGRFFAAEHEPAVVLAHAYWQRRFGGDPGVLGTLVHLDSQPFTVVGVAPRGFGGTTLGVAADVWVPVEAYRTGPNASWADAYLVPVVRLRPGVDAARATAAVDALAKRLPPERPHVEVRGARLEPLTGLPGWADTMLVQFVSMLLGTAALVLVIAIVNVAGMMLARGVTRRRELAVRLAIGAGRGRIVRQLLAESVLLAVLGGAGGVLLAWGGTRVLERIHVPTLPSLGLEFPLDARVLAIALTLTLATGILFGLAPALRASRPELLPALKEGGGGGARRGTRGRSVFVGMQLGASVLLLVVAGLLVRSLQHGLAVDPGFDPEGVVIARTNLTPHGYDRVRGRAFYAQLVERVRALPGVEGVGLASFVLLGGVSSRNDVSAPDTAPGQRVRASAVIGVVDPGFFDVLRIPLVAGQAFTAADRDGAPPVVVVNETLARRLWPERSPLGERLGEGSREHLVVGVARDGKHGDLTEPAQAVAYYPFAQRYTGEMTLYVRTPTPARTIEQIRHEVRALDANVAVDDAMPLTAVVDASLLPQRYTAFVVGLFGLLGLALAAIGVYGLTAFQVAQRSRELGIRIALGARALDVVRLVVGRGAWTALAGGGAGLALAAAATRVVQSFLFGVSPLDPVTFAAVPLLLGAVLLAASVLPARRATRVDPVEALRAE